MIGLTGLTIEGLWEAATGIKTKTAKSKTFIAFSEI